MLTKREDGSGSDASGPRETRRVIGCHWLCLFHFAVLAHAHSVCAPTHHIPSALVVSLAQHLALKLGPAKRGRPRGLHFDTARASSTVRLRSDDP